MSGFEVLQAGGVNLIQDRGRFGYQHLGITHSGILDEEAYFYANLILQNSQDTSVLEIFASGLKLRAHEETTVCVTGARFDIELNEKRVSSYKTILVQVGDILHFTKQHSALRAYLAVKDGFCIPQELGSSSVTLKEKLGGLNGKMLQKGDFLPFVGDKENNKTKPLQSLRPEFIPSYPSELTLRIVLGYQEEYFSKEALEIFFSSTFQTTNDMNRMGVRLTASTPIECKMQGIVSEGNALGAVQVMPDGNIAVLLKDRQTIGGYPKIGSVLPFDCFRLAQTTPFSILRFEAISLENAQAKMKKFYSFFRNANSY